MLAIFAKPPDHCCRFFRLFYISKVLAIFATPPDHCCCSRKRSLVPFKCTLLINCWSPLVASALIGHLASIPWLRYQRQLEMFIQMQSNTRIQETDNRLLIKINVAISSKMPFFFFKRKYSYLWRLNCCPLITGMSITIFPRQKIVPSVAAQ